MKLLKACVFVMVLGTSAVVAQLPELPKIDPPIQLPEAGPTLLLLGLALAATEACRRWIKRKSRD